MLRIDSSSYYFLKAIESIHLWLNLQNTALKDSTSEEDISTRTEPTKGFVSERSRGWVRKGRIGRESSAAEYSGPQLGRCAGATHPNKWEEKREG